MTRKSDVIFKFSDYDFLLKEVISALSRFHIFSSYGALKCVKGSNLQATPRKNNYSRKYLPVPLEAPTKPIFAKFYLGAHIPDVIIYSKFYLNRLSGFDYVRVEFRRRSPLHVCMLYVHVKLLTCGVQATSVHRVITFQFSWSTVHCVKFHWQSAKARQAIQAMQKITRFLGRLG